MVRAGQVEVKPVGRRRTDDAVVYIIGGKPLAGIRVYLHELAADGTEEFVLKKDRLPEGETKGGNHIVKYLLGGVPIEGNKVVSA